eukprot:scaffold76056_cov70-Phaeocystis_antarctica.AAC.12
MPRVCPPLRIAPRASSNFIIAPHRVLAPHATHTIYHTTTITPPAYQESRLASRRLSARVAPGSGTASPRSATEK